MQKTLRLLFFFFISVLLITMLLSWLMPLSQAVDRRISIRASTGDVYAQLVSLEQFNQWSVWNLDDSTVKHTLSGEDGKVGAVSTWSGDPAISGEGRLEITAVEPDRFVAHRIQFISPQPNEARSSFSLQEEQGITTVSWHFEMHTPRPWNIFNLFSSLDKQLGAAFDSSLVLLKRRTEKSGTAGPGAAFDILEMEWPTTAFALIKQSVRPGDIPAFVQSHLPLLYAEAAEQKMETGPATVLYFTTDKTDPAVEVAAALPLPAGKELGSAVIRTATIKAVHALYTDYFGAPAQTALALDVLRRKLAADGRKEQAPVIEQYLNNRQTEPDTTRWKTRVIVLTAD